LAEFHYPILGPEAVVTVLTSGGNERDVSTVLRPEQKYVRVFSYEWVFERCKGDKRIVSRVDYQSGDTDAINYSERARTGVVVVCISEAVSA